MLLGHISAALIAKRVAPKISLGTLLASTQFLDLLWPLFLALGIEHSRITPGITLVTPLDLYDIPYSHSLVAALGWSILGAALAKWYYRDIKSTLLVGACVLSHWFLDLPMHRPDLPLFDNSGPFFGWGLWNSLPASLLIEGGLWATGLVVYTRMTQARDRIGRWAFVAFVATLLIYIGGVFGPPPPDITAVMIVGLASWIFVFWAAWLDRHRKLRT